MGAPRNNKYALGNKGGRRPSQKEEEQHLLMWHQKTNVKNLMAGISSGEYSISDMYYLRALKGDVKILNNIANKVLADLHAINTKSQEDITIRWVTDMEAAQDELNKKRQS